MTVRFLADENINTYIVDGLRSREPAIDILDVKTAGLRGTKDPALLEIAAVEDRILITYDRRTMVRHVRDLRAAGKPVPGVFIVPDRPSAIGEIIDCLLLVWIASEAEEWRDVILYVRAGNPRVAGREFMQCAELAPHNPNTKSVFYVCVRAT